MPLQFLFLTLLLVVASTGFGQAPATVIVKMGSHTLGETVEQYRDVEQISARCNLLLNESKLAAKIRKWDEAEKKNRHQNMQNPDPRPYQYELCQQLEQAERGVTETYSSPMFEVTFFGGRLVRFRKLFDASATESFNQILADLIAKYGAPDLKATETLQNSYGAQFPVGRAHWTLADKTTIAAVENAEYINSVGYVRNTLVTIARPNAPSVEEPHKNPF